MKLLHTGDLHLDSPFSGTDIFSADKRREMQRNLLRRIFKCAKEEQCDMILIAGDLFDGKYITPETAALVQKLFKESTCPIIIAPGNHDPYTEGSFYQNQKFPDHVHIFSSSELQCFEFEEQKIKIFGYAFTSAVMQSSPLNQAVPSEKDGYLHLLCAHADLSSPVSRYCPITVGDILRFDIDYAALGHIHMPPMTEHVGNTTVCYCGCPEGRSYDELGDGCVVLVTIEDGQVSAIERRIVSENRYIIDELNVSGCSERSDIFQLIEKAVRTYETTPGTHLRLCLVGTFDSNIVLDEGTLAKESIGNLASLELRNLTVPCTDGNYLLQDVTLKGAVYRTLYAKFIDEDSEVRRKAMLALQIALAAIDGRTIPREEEYEP